MTDQTHTIDFNIKGKAHTFVMKGQRFEKHVDGIDKLIHAGKDLEHIKKKFGNSIVSHKPSVGGWRAERNGTPAKSKTARVVTAVAKATNTGFDKKAHVASHFKAGMTVGQVAKAAAESSNGQLTVANARYLATKHGRPQMT